MSTDGTAPTIACCVCGVPIVPNHANMCVTCLRNQVDITEGIPRQLALQYCKGCDRYLRPPWVHVEPESRELLALCLKKIRGLGKVKLVDAGFVWTEPHARRIKIKLTLQKEAFTATILQQVMLVEFVVNGVQCEDCKRSFTAHTWKSIVQVRQKADHKRTMFYLEQLTLKHGAHQQSINIKDAPDGIDFYYGHRSHAQKFVDFLQTVVPCRYKTAKELVSQDANNNSYNYKYTFSVEVVPVCKDDLVCLPSKLARQCGGICPLALCLRVTNQIILVDTSTGRVMDLRADVFWRDPFRPLRSSKSLIEFVVLDIEPVGPPQTRLQLAEVTVARYSDLGKNDTQYTVPSHLGNVLKVGDIALGYDLSHANLNDADLDGLRGQDLPDLILVKKSYREIRKKRNKPRPWTLKQLSKEVPDFTPRRGAEEMETVEMERFLEDLEEDPELRRTINLYKTKARQPAMDSNPHDEDAEAIEVGLEELLEELTLTAEGPDEVSCAPPPPPLV